MSGELKLMGCPCASAGHSRTVSRDSKGLLVDAILNVTDTVREGSRWAYAAWVSTGESSRWCLHLEKWEAVKDSGSIASPASRRAASYISTASRWRQAKSARLGGVLRCEQWWRSCPDSRGCWRPRFAHRSGADPRETCSSPPWSG